MTKLTIEIDDQAYGADTTHPPIILISVDGERVGIIQTLTLAASTDNLIPKVDISILDYSAFCTEEAHAEAVKRNIDLLRKVPFLNLNVIDGSRFIQSTFPWGEVCSNCKQPKNIGSHWDEEGLRDWTCVAADVTSLPGRGTRR